MKKITLLATLLLLTIGSGSVFSKTTYSIGVENIRYLPYYGLKNGRWVGFSRELFDRFGRHQNIQFTYKPHRVKNLYKEFVVKRSLDFKFPDNPYWNSDLKSQGKIHYSEPAILFTDGVMTLNKNIENKPIKVKRLGVVYGFTVPGKIESMEKEGKLVVVREDSIQHLVETVLNRKIDGVYLNTDVGKRLSREIGGSGSTLTFNNKLPFLFGTYQLSSIKHPKTIEAFNQFQNKNRTWIQRLKKKYKIQL